MLSDDLKSTTREQFKYFLQYYLLEEQSRPDIVHGGLIYRFINGIRMLKLQEHPSLPDKPNTIFDFDFPPEYYSRHVAYIPHYYEWKEGEYQKAVMPIHRGKLDYSKVLYDGFPKLHCLSIAWCIPSKLYLHTKSSIERMRNAFFTEGLILLHCGKFDADTFLVACIELFSIKSHHYEYSNHSLPQRFGNIECAFPNSILLYVIKMFEVYDYIKEHREQLLRWEYEEGHYPYHSLPCLPKSITKDLTREELLSLLDVDKSRSENQSMFKTKTRLSASLFDKLVNKYGIKFNRKQKNSYPSRTKKTNPIIARARDIDVYGNLWRRHEFYIFDYTVKHDGYLRYVHEHLYNKHLDMYFLGEVADGKIIIPESSKRIINQIKIERTKQGYKRGKDEKKWYKDICKQYLDSLKKIEQMEQMFGRTLPSNMSTTEVSVQPSVSQTGYANEHKLTPKNVKLFSGRCNDWSTGLEDYGGPSFLQKDIREHSNREG